MCIFFCYRALLYNFVINFKYRYLSYLVWGCCLRPQSISESGQVHRAVVPQRLHSTYGNVWAGTLLGVVTCLRSQVCGEIMGQTKSGASVRMILKSKWKHHMNYLQSHRKRVFKS